MKKAILQTAFNRRQVLKNLAQTAGGVVGSTMLLNQAFASENYIYDQKFPTPQNNPDIIPVENYIHPTLTTGSTDPVGIAWVFAFDISTSIDSDKNEYQTQIESIANTIERDDFRESIFMEGGPQSAAIFVVDFDSSSKLQLPGIDFRENDPEKFKVVANIIRNLKRRDDEYTHPEFAIQNASICFDKMPWKCDRKYVNIMTDGKGHKADQVKLERKRIAERHEAIVSSLTTRVGTINVYEWCQEHLTTPVNTYRRKNGEFLPGGLTVEVATELETQGQGVASYKDQVFLAARKQILLQTAGIEMDINRRVTDHAVYDVLKRKTGVDYAQLDMKYNNKSQHQKLVL